MTLPPPGKLIRDHLLPSKNVPAEIRRRLSPYQFETVAPTRIPEMQDEGWVLDKRNKRTVRMRKPKAHDVAFEDRVWATFARLGFWSLNKDRTFTLNYGSGESERQQIDVFAADDDVILVVECKSASETKQGQFKKEIEAIQGRRAGILRAIKAEYKHHKVKFVLATNNYGVTKLIAERIASADIIHMSDDVIDYYLGLAEHLGEAARFQLLGNLFAGQKIPNLNQEVVAIEASMGGHKYYSFSIEPDRLLKLGYILHRSKANSSLMPTYQRLIKKARLKNVAQFVELGGYFPNSLVLSLEGGARGLQFDPFPMHPGQTRAGILHLPQTFRAAYVIDGQHRLYGYSSSSRAANDLIPVVAFVSLSRSDQMRLFMQINENQQAVPKNLRNTLNADLLYASDDLREQAKALKLVLAQRLGEDKVSPLYGRVQVGEDAKTPLRCLTIDAVARGVERGGFIGTFTKTEVKEIGTFYRGTNDSTGDALFDYLTLALGRIRDNLDRQYKLGSAEGGFVFINNGIESIVRILGDVVVHLAQSDDYDPRQKAPGELYADAAPYLDSMIDHIEGLDPAEALQYRQLYGSGAGTKYWRRLQQAINEARPEFDPPGLAEYLRDAEKQFNDEARDMIDALEAFMKDDIRKRLQDKYGADWFKDGVPRKLKLEAGKMMIERNLDRSAGQEITEWDCLYIVDYRDIMTQTHELWRELFEKRYTPPGDEQKSGGWRARSDWVVAASRLRNDVHHQRPISVDDHEFLTTLHTWLVKGQTDNDL
ncbi:DGQHR domain-containing protein [Solicola gregarius]|uniref:DGQHR domain-containing protein n=1 Tax=Solicola gregarius TaxID=2908642 RepID=A0AA46TNK9_9ACTN|nr:DGQHR domain-containing protein [Solicola gregarius]UYM07673.1 DGQHR domain-containing protein [Solicola gregarius]